MKNFFLQIIFLAPAYSSHPFATTTTIMRPRLQLPRRSPVTHSTEMNRMHFNEVQTPKIAFQCIVTVSRNLISVGKHLCKFHCSCSTLLLLTSSISFAPEKMILTKLGQVPKVFGLLTTTVVAIRLIQTSRYIG